MLTDNDLRAAMSSITPETLTKVVGWTATIDDRRIPPTVGFFLELFGAADQGMASYFSILPCTSAHKLVSHCTWGHSPRPRTRAGTRV